VIELIWMTLARNGIPPHPLLREMKKTYEIFIKGS
jgi:hypothetical protein